MELLQRSKQEVGHATFKCIGNFRSQSLDAFDIDPVQIRRALLRGQRPMPLFPAQAIAWPNGQVQGVSLASEVPRIKRLTFSDKAMELIRHGPFHAELAVMNQLEQFIRGLTEIVNLLLVSKLSPTNRDAFKKSLDFRIGEGVSLKRTCVIDKLGNGLLVTERRAFNRRPAARRDSSPIPREPHLFENLHRRASNDDNHASRMQILPA